MTQATQPDTGLPDIKKWKRESIPSRGDVAYSLFPHPEIKILVYREHRGMSTRQWHFDVWDLSIKTGRTFDARVGHGSFRKTRKVAMEDAYERHLIYKHSKHPKETKP